MSHVVTVEAKCTDEGAIRAACRRLGAECLGYGRHALYQGPLNGLGVQLKGWQYPLVINTGSGQVRFDNYEGRWGDARELDRFKQAYAVCRARAEAESQGAEIEEERLADGSVRLVIQA